MSRFIRVTLPALGGSRGGAKLNDEAALRRPDVAIDFLNETGAGEGIRTLDPNLGKVVLYP